MTVWEHSNIEYRMLAGMFGISRLTACKMVNDIAKQIVTHLIQSMQRHQKATDLEKSWKVLNSFWDIHKLRVSSMVLTYQSFIHSTAEHTIITEKVSIAKTSKLSWHFYE